MKFEVTKKNGAIVAVTMSDGDDSGGVYQVTIGQDYAENAVACVREALDDVIAVKHIDIWDNIAPSDIYGGKFHPTKLDAIKAFERQATKIIRDAAKKLRQELADSED